MVEIYLKLGEIRELFLHFVVVISSSHSYEILLLESLA